MPNTVWILGSGFSKSLGGPLLKDLLSDRSGNESRQRLADLELVNDIIADRVRKDEPDLLVSDAVTPDYGWVYNVFAEHLRGSRSSDGHAVHWDHAEEFLTFVDSSASNIVRQGLLQKWLPADRNSDEDMATFRRHAVQAIASECHFVYDEDISTDEIWEPYLGWASRLSAENDTIITFNYDLVLEELSKGKRVHQVHREGVATPTQPNPAPGRIPIFKLHGSVDWFVDDNGGFSRNEDFVGAVSMGLRPLLGTPGITKRTVRQRQLQEIWNKAAYALRRADVIVFLGYRSPPSDPDARTFILDHISTNEGIDRAPKHRRVHLVLGPDTNDSAIVRIERLIDFAMGAKGFIKRYIPGYAPSMSRYQVLKQPLYVEDFLSAYHDRELYGPDPQDD